MSDSDFRNNLDIMAQIMPEAALYEQLAEECAELAQASLKMARILRDENKTPKTKSEVMENLIEEYSDVTLCALVLELRCDHPQMEYKLNRWVDRNV